MTVIIINLPEKPKLVLDFQNLVQTPWNLVYVSNKSISINTCANFKGMPPKKLREDRQSQSSI